MQQQLLDKPNEQAKQLLDKLIEQAKFQPQVFDAFFIRHPKAQAPAVQDLLQKLEKLRKQEAINEDLRQEFQTLEKIQQLAKEK